MLRRLFLDHPASVGESYSEHFGVAARTGVALIGGGMAALIHAILPCAFKTTGSRTIIRLHREIAEKRAAVAAAEEQNKTANS
jgi:hypothetical protein